VGKCTNKDSLQKHWVLEKLSRGKMWKREGEVCGTEECDKKSGGRWVGLSIFQTTSLPMGGCKMERERPIQGREGLNKDLREERNGSAEEIGTTKKTAASIAAPQLDKPLPRGEKEAHRWAIERHMRALEPAMCLGAQERRGRHRRGGIARCIEQSRKPIPLVKLKWDQHEVPSREKGAAARHTESNRSPRGIQGRDNQAVKSVDDTLQPNRQLPKNVNECINDTPAWQYNK